MRGAGAHHGDAVPVGRVRQIGRRPDPLADPGRGDEVDERDRGRQRRQELRPPHRAVEEKRRDDPDVRVAGERQQHRGQRQDREQADRPPPPPFLERVAEQHAGRKQRDPRERHVVGQGRADPALEIVPAVEELPDAVDRKHDGARRRATGRALSPARRGRRDPSSPGRAGRGPGRRGDASSRRGRGRRWPRGSSRGRAGKRGKRRESGIPPDGAASCRSSTIQAKSSGAVTMYAGAMNGVRNAKRQRRRKAQLDAGSGIRDAGSPITDLASRISHPSLTAPMPPSPAAPRRSASPGCPTRSDRRGRPGGSRAPA